MSARTKIAKSLQVGAYAPQVFTPSPTGEHIKRAVGELHLTGVTICGETVTAEEPPDYKALCKQLAQAVENLSADNGYGLNVPNEYDSEHPWLVNAGSIRICKQALDAARQAGVL